METCFCESEQKLKINCLTKLTYCTCPKDPVEPLFQLKCCGKYVHKSCLNSYLLLKRNTYIYGNDWETHKESLVSSVDTCCYCTKKLDNSDIGILPYSNIEKYTRDIFIKLAKFCNVIIWIFMIVSVVSGLSDFIYSQNQIKYKLLDYCDTINNSSECVDHFKQSDAYKYTYIASYIFFIIGLIGIMYTYFFIMMSTFSLHHNMLFGVVELLYDFISGKTDEITPLIYTQLNDNYRTQFRCVEKYRNEMSKIQKEIRYCIIIILIFIILLIWQLAYPGLIIYYVKWYIPNQHPKSVNDIIGILEVYIKMFSTCNIFIMSPLLVIISLCLWGISIVLWFVLWFIGTECYTSCCAFITNYKNKRSNLSNLAQNKIQLFEIDVGQELKNHKNVRDVNIV